ncbi:MAG TPA: VOC family protein [Acidimicrobiia bacterium]|nr:VOC family protein [Acidimicrobiia bacterium]
MIDEPSMVARGLAVYLVYQDVALVSDWLVRALRFVEQGRFVDAGGVVTNAELAAGETVLLLERGAYSSEDYPRGTRWTGVWVDDPDEWYRQLIARKVDASPPEDEPWGVRLVRVVDPEGHIWALIRRSPTRASP